MSKTAEVVGEVVRSDFAGIGPHQHRRKLPMLTKRPASPALHIANATPPSPACRAVVRRAKAGDVVLGSAAALIWVGAMLTVVGFTIYLAWLAGVTCGL